MLTKSLCGVGVFTVLLGCNAQLDVKGAGGNSATTGGATNATGSATSTTGGVSNGTAGATSGTGGVFVVTQPMNRPIEPGVPGNPAECPATTPSGTCTTEGLRCMYRSGDTGSGEAQLCGCWPPNNSELWWGCIDVPSATYCPDSEPVTGESCYGVIGAQCSYLSGDMCTCSSDTILWDCAPYPYPSSPNSAPMRPPNLDGTTIVSAMTDAQRQTWCQWYQDFLGCPGCQPPPVGGVDATGHLYNVGCGAGWSFWDHAMFPTIPATYCAQNLALSTCSATVEQLSDCLVTFRRGEPSPLGCGRYMDTPGCADTIFMTNTHSPSEGSGTVTTTSCGLRVK